MLTDEKTDEGGKSESKEMSGCHRPTATRLKDAASYFVPEENFSACWLADLTRCIYCFETMTTLYYR